MIARYLDRARRWLDDTVRSSAVKGLSESVEGRLVRDALPVLLSYIVVSAVLVGQLLLARWPQSFAAFLLTSPLITTALLAALAVAARPAAAARVPLYACLGFGLLAALQCVMGACALTLPVLPDRVAFSLVSAAVVLCLCLGLSRSFVRDAVRRLASRRRPAAPEPRPPAADNSDEEEQEDDESRSDAFADARE